MSDQQALEARGGAEGEGAQSSASAPLRVLVLGGTGRTGGRVVEQLLARGAHVRAIVRSAERLPAGAVGHPALDAVEADLLSMPAEKLAAALADRDAVLSCLGHTLNLKGIYGAPRDLVERATRRVCGAIEAGCPPRPVRYVLMGSVSVNHPLGGDVRRQAAERALVALIRAVLPPARDNQRASEYLCREVGLASPFLEWVAVRPDSLTDGEVTAYSAHEHLVSSLFQPDETNMSNVAHFMCELVSDQMVWDSWRGRFPVVINDR